MMDRSTIVGTQGGFPTLTRKYDVEPRRGSYPTRSDTGIVSKSFCAARCEAEHFIAVEVPKELSLHEQIALLRERYAKARKSLGLTPDTAIFKRVFVSDVMNQLALVQESGLAGDADEGPVATSIVQQPPLSGAKVALLAYHVESRGGFKKRPLSKKHLLVEKNGLGHVWSTRLCAGVNGAATSAAAQTRGVFSDLIGTIARQGGTLRDNCVRTWIYLKDVDVFYQDMVDSRRKLFVEQGMSKDTHWIASTGIEGACAHRRDLVAMDAYSILGLLPRQVFYLNDFDHLCTTMEYNVTFERGTRIGYADRFHHFISGTASIDSKGQVVHPGDVLGQLRHALGNVDALLRSGSAGIDDLMYLIVYLRDPTDYASINDHLALWFPDLPYVIVQGAVCRPQWLVEVEGVAVSPNDDRALPVF